MQIVSFEMPADFFGKNKEKYFKMLSAEILPSMLIVNTPNYENNDSIIPYA